VPRVLGIDPGSRVTGYAVITVGVGPSPVLGYVECGVIEATVSAPLAVRLGEIVRGLSEIIRELEPTVVAVEDVFFGKNVRSMIALAQARGAAIAACDLEDLAVTAYAPAQVKLAVTGRGRAGKPQVSAMVRGLLGLRGAPRADATDALAVAVAHALMAPRQHALELARLGGGDPAAGKGRRPAPARRSVA
jgi:crossover junction endodeoxyribonuclease RuvC